MSKKKNIIRIIDVTNRDGVQTSRLGLAKLEKTMFNIKVQFVEVNLSKNCDKKYKRIQRFGF